MERKINHPVTEIEKGEVFSYYDANGISVYKEGILAKLDYTNIPSYITAEYHEILQHLLERIQQLETTNKLLCKALGIRRGITDVQKSSS